MKRNIKIYVSDIIEYMERSEEYIKGMNFEQFIEDKKTQDAVIRCIEIIGEAAKNVPDEIRNKYSFIPWRDMAGMRDKIIHRYFTVDFEEVWLVVKKEIPKLKSLIKNVLKNLEDSE